MAIRKQLSHDTLSRERIKTSQLLNRLHQFAFGEAELSQSQVRAIEILLKKTLPDLSNVEISGNADSPLIVKIVHFGEG